MKLIIAIIRPERLEAVQRELKAVLDEGDNYRMTIHPVDGHGRGRGTVEFFRGQEVQHRLVRKTELKIAVNDDYVQRTLDAICRGARSEPADAIGDGKIFVIPLEQCLRIRTGETGDEAV